MKFMSDEDRKKYGLVGAFTRAANRAADYVSWVVTNYPSKSAAVSGAAADTLFLYQSILNGNWVGVAGALALGIPASWHLFRYGDPKIKLGEQSAFFDPQDKRHELNPIQVIANRKVYPWEYVAFMRMTFMMTMLLGGLGVARNSGMSIGEVSYSAMALAGYLVKLGVAEQPQGSVAVPEEGNWLQRKAGKARAYVLENPNATAGKLWIAGLIPYAVEGTGVVQYLADVALKGNFIEAVFKPETAKVASAALYFLPDFFTMISSKRAQALNPPPVGP